MLWGRFFRFFSSQAEEQFSSTCLRWFGVALSFTHILTAFDWIVQGHGVAWIANPETALCWPQFPNCSVWRTGSEDLAYGILTTYLCVSIAALVSYSMARRLYAYSFLLSATLLKLAIFCLDYRFMGNYHYMTFLMLATFLFFPAKKETIPLLICLFYFSAGIIKLNNEWLSGSALLLPAMVQGFPLKVLLLYVVVLELFWIWALLARSQWWHWAAMLQVFVFHAFSWHIVGYFYPLTMFTLLSFFPLQRFLEGTRPLLSQILAVQAPRTTYVVAGLFLSLQIPPWLFSPDAALTGEGRIWAENMLDATARCEAFSYGHYEEHWEEIPINPQFVGTRIQCDPIIFWNEARRKCKHLSRDNRFKGLSLQLYSRRSSQQEGFHRILAFQNFCESNPSYYTWRPNSWVQFSPAAPIYQSEMEPSSPGKITSNYRGNPARDSFATETISGDLHESWRLVNGNIGVHTASKASPAVDESGVYVGGDSGIFFAYDIAGKERWRFSIADADRGFHGTAALDHDFVYAGAYNGRLYKLQKSTGKPEWVVPLGVALGASPLLYGDHIYVGVELVGPPNGYVAKLDRSSGRTIWKSNLLGAQLHSSPALDLENGSILFGANNGFFYSLNEANGIERWRFRVGGPIKSTPLLRGSQIYFTSWDGFLYSVGRDSGTLVWSRKIGKSQSSPTLVPGSNVLVVGSTDGVFGVHAESGNLLWHLDTAQVPIIGSGLAVSGKSPKGEGSVWISCGKQNLCEISSQGDVRTRVRLRGDLTGVPVAYSGALYFSENGPGQLVKMVPENKSRTSRREVFGLGNTQETFVLRDKVRPSSAMFAH